MIDCGGVPCCNRELKLLGWVGPLLRGAPVGQGEPLWVMAPEQSTVGAALPPPTSRCPDPAGDLLPGPIPACCSRLARLCHTGLTPCRSGGATYRRTYFGREGVKPASPGSLMSYLTAWDSTRGGQAGRRCSPHPAPAPGSTPSKQCSSWSVKGTKAMPRELQTPTVPSPLARGPRFP